MRSTGIFCLLLCSVLSLPNQSVVTAAERPLMTHYSGSLVRPGGDDAEILRRFECLLIHDADSAFFHVLDDPRRGCPWPDSFGDLQPSSQSVVQPHLTYMYEDTNWFLPLPPLQLSLPSPAAADAEWKLGNWSYRLLELTESRQEGVWSVEAKEPRGRRQKLLVNQQSGVLVEAEMDVFMGRGDRFQLTIRKTSTEPVPAAQLENLAAVRKDLLKLQSSLNRRPDALLAELSERQIQDASAALENLGSKAEGTPLQRLVARISADTNQQQSRVMAVADRAGAMVNSVFPEFSLQLISGGSLDSKALAGQTVILHFWEYRDKPLSEPYGQTGYLEFLSNQFRNQKLSVIGVCCNPELDAPQTVRQAQRSARKAAEFMNLSYSIGHDNGTLLQTVGDPRENRGQLPLWIVIGPDGKVLHYHAGFYEIDTAVGLKALHEVVSGSLR